MKKIFYYFIVLFFFIVFSCDQDKETKNILEKRSSNYFIKNKIDINKFKSDYYIVKKPNPKYEHYVLKYYRTLDKDSIIIWFTIDDEADYFVQTNDNFDKYYRNKDTIK